jgi:hypothetical protein
MSAIRLAVLSACLMISLSPVVQACGLCGLFGHGSPTTVATTTAPAYVPTTVVAGYAPQTTYYAPAVVAPVPVTTYRPFLPIVPRPTTTYYASGYNPYSAAPVTVYRPVMAVQPVVTTTRLIPYTSYRMTYPTTVAYYGVAPVCNAAPACIVPPAPCTGCGGAPVESYNPPPLATPSDGGAMEAPSLPPGQPTTTEYQPLPVPSMSNYPPAQTAAPMIIEKQVDNSATVRQDNKPTLAPQPKPAPQGDTKSSGPEINSPNNGNPANIKENSLPTTEGSSSRDRTTLRPVRLVSRETTLAVQPPVRVLSGDLWRPAD